MKILAIDTATDETSAGVVEDTKILSNIVWSQASLHAKWGGVVPSLAQRQHEERIDWVIEKAMKEAKVKYQELDAVAVTGGPGLAIALGVGIDRAKKLAKKHKLPLIAVNHIEGHILSPLGIPKTKKEIANKLGFPAVAITASGGNTTLTLVEKIGKYRVLAQTMDDALGEALDKGARMLGLGYPGGQVLEEMAKEGKVVYSLPLPLAGRRDLDAFSYSGLKTAMLRLIEKKGTLKKTDIENLAASFQDMAFKHLINVSFRIISKHKKEGVKDLLIGGGVGANIELRKRLRKTAKDLGLRIWFPYSKKLYTDNAAMIGVAAYFKAKRNEFVKPEKIDREARAKVDGKFSFEM